MRDAVVEGPKNFDHLGFFDMHANVSARVSKILLSSLGQQTNTIATTPSQQGYSMPYRMKRNISRHKLLCSDN